jgi:hypothetical protein
MPQSMEGRVTVVTPDKPRRKAMKKWTKDGKPLSEDEMKEAMKAAGFAEEAEEEDAEAKEKEAARLLKEAEEAEAKGKKGAECKKALTGFGLSEATADMLMGPLEHIAAGNFVTIVRHAQGVNSDSPEGLAECAKALGIDTTPPETPAAPAAFDGAEMQKALEASVDARLTAAKAEYAEAVKALGTTIEGHLGAIEKQIEKSLRVPAQPRDVKPVPVDRVGNQATNAKVIQPTLEMRKSLMDLFTANETPKADRDLAGEMIKDAASGKLLSTDGLRRLNIIPAA